MNTILIISTLAATGWYLLHRLSKSDSTPSATDIDEQTLSSSIQADHAVASLLEIVEHIAASYAVPLPWNPQQRAAYQHDLALMIDSGDLESAAFALLARDGRVLFRYCVQWPDDPAQPPRLSWPELPLLPVHTIARSQFRVIRRGHSAAYAHRLELNWSSTDPSPRRPGCEFSSAAGSLSPLDAAAQLFVTNDARRTFTVVNVLPHGVVGFGRHPELPVDVYLHRDHFDRSPAVLEVGQSVTCFVVQTPRGLQGRCIRPARRRPSNACPPAPQGPPVPGLDHHTFRSASPPTDRYPDIDDLDTTCVEWTD